jgi:two-component system, sensor histidine kinase
VRAPDSVDPSSILRILVIDDDCDAADTFAELLATLGHEVKVAYDGMGGLNIDSVWAPHVIFLDLGLPAMDGYEVARQLRARQPDGRRIVALSGFARPTDHERSRRAGCDHHLVKPATLSDILQVLDGTGCERS